MILIKVKSIIDFSMRSFKDFMRWVYCCIIILVSCYNVVSGLPKMKDDRIHFLHENREKERSVQDVVSGKVINEDGERLEGVTVMEKETTNSTSTDRKGEFSLVLKSQNTTLIFSLLGYKTTEIEVGMRKYWKFR